VTVPRPDPAGDGHRGTHAHLWTLPDGTGLHAPYGRLVRDPDSGRVCCHLCGRWFRSLGSHLRRHGLSAAGYRQAMGLCRTRSLTADDVSLAISRRQAEAYRRGPQVRGRLAEGQRLARSGQLTWRARGAVDREQPAELIAVRRDALHRGRQRREQEREHAVRGRLAELGCSDLADYLRTAYADGASLADLRAATGLGTTRLRQTMTTAGIDLRRPGHTTLAGRRSRAEAAEREAAARVGTDDIAAWLTERRAAGWSLLRLGEAVGRSGPWVRRRLLGSAE
jgi:hypothetical protein